MMRYSVPEPLRLIALLVCLGAGLTSTAYAAENESAMSWPQRGAQLALVPVKTVMHGLKLEWAEDALQHPAIGAYFSDEGLALNDDRRPQDGVLSVGWKPMPESQLQAGLVSDAFLVDPQPGVYFRLQHRW